MYSKGIVLHSTPLAPCSAPDRLRINSSAFVQPAPALQLKLTPPPPPPPQDSSGGSSAKLLALEEAFEMPQLPDARAEEGDDLEDGPVHGARVRLLAQRAELLLALALELLLASDVGEAVVQLADLECGWPQSSARRGRVGGLAGMVERRAGKTGIVERELKMNALLR